MATLEKIRSQQKLLFTIVIIALFLFIISIASADSIRRLFGPGTTIAQVGNQKIDYEDYRQLVDKASQQQQQQQMDREEISQRAISSLVQEALLNDQIKKLGINVTDAEISRAMTGDVPHPVAQNFIRTAAQYMQLPTANGSALLDAITNPGRYNLTNDQLNYLAQNVFGTYTMGDAWAQQENAVEKYIQQQAFSSLLGGLFTANELDAQSVYNDNSTTSRISYVTAPYSSVTDEIEVTDADIKAKYDEYKPMYKLAEETREIDYIIVSISPSRDDYNAAEVEVDRLVETLRANPGMEGASTSSKFVHDSKTVALKDIKKDRDLGMIPDSLLGKEKVYKYRRLANTFRVAKVLDVTPQVDSINISLYVAMNKAQADSILNLIDGGKSFREIALENQNQSADSVWQSLVGAPEALASVMENATVGKAFVYTDSVQGANAVYRVNKRNAPKQYADIVLFSYVVDPSATTISDIKTQLSSFLASNSKGDAFSENADSLYTLRHATISASTPKLGYMPSQRGQSGGYSDTRHAIKWAMNAKKGEVSPILEDNRDFYVVVALKDIYGDQYVPYTSPQVKDALTAMVRSDKKGDKLIEKYQGKANDLAGYASLFGGEVLTDSTVVFTSPRLASLGMNEYALQGQIAGAQKGALVGPVKGNNEVMVFVVDDSAVAGRPYDYIQDGGTFINMFGIKDYFNLLVGDKKIKNNTLTFENYDK